MKNGRSLEYLPIHHGINKRLYRLYMLPYFRYLFFVVMICFFPFQCLKAEVKKLSDKELMQWVYNEQDIPMFGTGNPLKGFSKFIFYSRFYASKDLADKVHVVIEKVLSQYGDVEKINLQVKTDKGSAVDFSKFDAGASLIYEIKNLSSIDGKDLGIVRASLNLTTSVTIDRTKKESDPYIWTNNCFLKGDINKNLESLVSQSLNYLLKAFSITYSSVNSEKPLFQISE